MKLRKKFLTAYLLGMSLCANAQNITPADAGTQNGDSGKSQEDLIRYISRWAQYLGYDLESKDPKFPEPTTDLVSSGGSPALEYILAQTVLGSTPISPIKKDPNNSSQDSNGPLVTEEVPGAAEINALANNAFSEYGNTKETSIANASLFVDQYPYQPDPVSQSIFNILGTPDTSYCESQSGLLPDAVCKLVAGENEQIPFVQSQVVANAAAPISKDFYSYKNLETLLPDLNSNSLLGPLTYSTKDSQDNDKKSFRGANQLQQAANFIRYVSGSVIPLSLPSYSNFTGLYNDAESGSPAKKSRAMNILSNYFATLHIYAAQTSVGMSNLYYIFGKRIPQNKIKSDTGSDKDNKWANIKMPSQAVTEHNMATWRIHNPVGDTQWVDKINDATPATVQKEIALILSEINYQLYLDRQIQERLLLTNTVSLLVGTRAGQPSADLAVQTAPTPDAQPQQ